jgi:hypothetical protein
MPNEITLRDMHKERSFALTLLFVSFSTLTMVSHNLAGADEMNTQEKIIITTVIYPVEWAEKNTLLLVESIRAFSGALANAPIKCYAPQYGKELSRDTKSRLTDLNATVIPFDIDIEVARFFFAADIQAAWLAESTFAGKTELLVWLGSNTIVLQEPEAFLLSDDKNLGYRPVHHTNVGSIFDSPLDSFWILVYDYCSVPGERIFPMETHVDGKVIRPYFNAGIIITRPEKGLMKKWHDTFFEVYQKPELRVLYEKDERYVIFIHQALLSGIILNMFRRDEIQELPYDYNYPLNLYNEDVTANRPASIEEVVTLRHEGFYLDPGWMDKIPASDSLKHWLAERLAQ